MLEQLESAFPPIQIIARDSQRALTAKQLLERCRRLADALKVHGIEILALHCDNGLDWIIADFACQIADICLIPLPTFFSAEQLVHVFDSMPVDAVICEHAGLYSGLLDNIRKKEKNVCGSFDLLVLETVDRDSTLPAGTQKVTFTSGSTGTPKGVCLGKEQILLQARALAKAVNLDSPRHLCLLPLSTLLENIAGLYAPLLAGGEVMVPGLAEIGFSGSSSLDANTFVRTISRYSPDSLIVTPQLLVVLVSAARSGWPPPSTLKFVAVGGGRVSRELVAQAHALGVPVYEGYGLSECVSVVSLNTAQRHNHDSCGYPLPHLDVELEEGEIVVSGNAMLGYMGEPESWGQERIYTGDLGRLDGAGYLYIDGRKKNLLISSYGRNIHPEWVESKLLGHALIAECVLFGDGRPYCTALLTSRRPEDDGIIQKIIDDTNAGLPDYARIKNWRHFPAPLSKTRTLVTENGRPRRQAIASHYSELIDSLYDV